MAATDITRIPTGIDRKDRGKMITERTKRVGTRDGIDMTALMTATVLRATPIQLPRIAMNHT
jgi:hypothetical protein